MDRYKPVDITKKAKALCKEFPISEEKPHPFALPHSHRIMEKDKNGATKRGITGAEPCAKMSRSG